MTLIEHTVGGLHDFLLQFVLPRCLARGRRVLDLGAGTGALTVRLERLGFEVVAADVDAAQFEPDLPFVRVDLNDPDALRRVGGPFDLVTAVEVIEHLESPIGFLRGIRSLLDPGGVAIITTLNMDNAPTRVKFLVTGKLHMMDALVPDHISQASAPRDRARRSREVPSGDAGALRRARLRAPAGGRTMNPLEDRIEAAIRRDPGRYRSWHLLGEFLADAKELAA
jgi:2-polyprenyl-3-methyl-5-hydroxy-6-metoxy-1,4-benzoquinol methylase